MDSVVVDSKENDWILNALAYDTTFVQTMLVTNYHLLYINMHLELNIAN